MSVAVIVGHDADHCVAISAALAPIGVRCEAFPAAKEAWAHLSEYGADLVITSYLIRREGAFVSDGALVLLNRLRVSASVDRPWMASVPIIVTYGESSSARGVAPQKLLSHLRVDAFLSHPLDYLELTGRVASILAREARRNTMAAE